MLKILILDDEQIIVDGLYQYLLNHRMDEYEIFTAEDVQQALQIMAKARIDILVTDIEMPDEDGLSLHSKVLEQYPHCKVIFFTAHANFNYAYHSNKFDSKLVLKSEGFAYLLQVIDETALVIYKNLLQENLPQPMDAEDDVGQPQNIIQLLQQKDANPSDVAQVLLQNNSVLAWDVAYGCFLLHLKGQKSHDFNPHLTEINRVICKNLAELQVTPLITNFNEVLFVLQHPNQELTASHIESVGRTLELLLDPLCELAQTKIQLSILTTPQPLNQFVHHYHRLKQALLPYQQRQMELICQVGDHQAPAIEQGQVSIAVNRFIDEHYAEDVSLTDIAKHLYLSPAYVSRTYKQETKDNVVNRIQSVRLQQALVLLKTSNMKIHEVASTVGFASPRYFNTLFKKWHGITPKVFREQLER